MEDMKKEVAGKSRAEEMKEKYGKVYRVGATIEVDVDREDGRVLLQAPLHGEL